MSINRSSILKPTIIAIDGFSSCGKSTLAKDLAKELNYTFIDTGAMYRAVSLYFLDNKITIADKDYTPLLHSSVSIDFQTIDEQNTTFLNGVNVEHQIRQPRVANIVSEVAKNSSIRRFLVAQQRAMGTSKSLVMDGRDIGSVVFPNANLKLFVTADINIRAERRYQELITKGVKTSIEKIKENLTSRDRIDSSRNDSPLLQADDAILIDTSHHTRESQMQEALEHLLSKK